MSWRGEVGGLGVQVQAQSAAYWSHCRSSEPPPPFFAESWSGLDQARSSMAMGSSSCGNDDDAEMASFPLSDYQPETWWPPINVQINLQSTVHQNILNVDRKPTDLMTITPSFTGQASCSNIEFPPPLIPDTPVPRLEVWCPEPPNPATTTTTSDPPPPTSALAAVNTAIAEVAATVTPSLPSLPSPAGLPSGSSRAPKGVRRKAGKCASAPASPTRDASLAVQKASSGNKRPLTQRQNHIWSERQRRKGMNYLFESLRSLLPQPSPTNKTDKSTVVGEIIKYIQTLQVQLEVLTKKQQQMVAAREMGTTTATTTSDTTNPVVAVPIAVPRRGLFAGTGEGVTVVDHSGEAGSATAVSVVPPAGRESCLQSYVGANVGVHVCGLNVFITTSSPRGRHGLLHQLLLTLHRHALDVINATISSTNASVFHCLHCQASQDAELLNNDLHHALQSIINQFR